MWLMCILQELGYGFYDGFTGVVTHPLDGAKGEGLLGFAKGVGKGFVGLISKPVAGKSFLSHQ
jgi:sterol 3beta-glucosyltransferase